MARGTTGLAFLVDADAYPLRLGPIHRVIPRLDPATAPAWRPRHSPSPSAGRRRGADDCRTRCGGWRRPERTEPRSCWRARRSPADQPPGRRRARGGDAADASERWRALDASVMQELLFARLWSIKDNERDVLISHDAAEAVRPAAETGGTAVLCNPMALAAVMDLAAHGERVPRKSTSFGPKPRTGLVLRTLTPDRRLIRGRRQATAERAGCRGGRPRFVRDELVVDGS